MVHIYFGDGKGKTTAAIGLGVRACGQGLRTEMIQFFKTAPTGELAGVGNLPGFSIHRFEHPHGFLQTMTPVEKDRLAADVDTAMRFAEETDADLLILDEVLDAVALGLIEETRLIGLLQNRGSRETVLTGHSLPESLQNAADYVTEMKKHRHPYDHGVQARKGIEY